MEHMYLPAMQHSALKIVDKPCILTRVRPIQAVYVPSVSSDLHTKKKSQFHKANSMCYLSLSLETHDITSGTEELETLFWVSRDESACCIYDLFCMATVTVPPSHGAEVLFMPLGTSVFHP